jgi:hypothetical protein
MFTSFWKELSLSPISLLVFDSVHDHQTIVSVDSVKGGFIEEFDCVLKPKG